jgi:dolichol kinase
MLLIVEKIGKVFKWSQEFTRKIIHIGAGLWIWGLLYFFEHWYFGIIPFGTFIVLNYVFYRQQTFKAMDTEESTPGTVYFAISITIMLVWLWRTGGGLDRVPIAAAALMAMTLGDAFANIVGRRWGKHTYTVWGHTRSWEGTAAMAVTGLAGIVLTLAFLPGSALSPNSIPLSGIGVVIVSLAGTAAAAISEALSPKGTDNLSVPLVSGAVMLLISGLF